MPEGHKIDLKSLSLSLTTDPAPSTLGQVLEGHKITHSDHGLSRLPPMCLHEDGHFQCSFNRIDGRRVDFFKRPLSGDCRDLTNLNTVQLILSALCGVRDGVVRCARVRDGVVRCAE